MSILNELLELSEATKAALQPKKIKLRGLIDEDEKLQQLFDDEKLDPMKPTFTIKTGLKAPVFDDKLYIWHYKNRTYVEANGQAYNSLPYSYSGIVSPEDIKADYLQNLRDAGEID